MSRYIVVAVLRCPCACSRLPVRRESLPRPKWQWATSGAHAELVGECQRLTVVTLSVLGAACRRDVTGEAEGVGFASPSPQPAGEGQGLSGVAGGLVDPLGREAGHPRA